MSTPRFLADEDLRFQIVLATRRLAPHLVFVTVVEEGLTGASDDQVLAFAQANDWLLVSHDVNTMPAAAFSRIENGEPFPGLLMVQQKIPVGPIIDDLVAIWSASEAEEWTNHICFLPLS